MRWIKLGVWVVVAAVAGFAAMYIVGWQRGSAGWEGAIPAVLFVVSLGLVQWRKAALNG